MADVGRPPVFETPEDVAAKFKAWQQYLAKDNDEIPDVEGFCDFVGAYRDLLSEYEKKPDFSDTVKKVKNWIYYRKKQLAMKAKMPAPIFIFDAKNNAGYTDKQDVDVTTAGEKLNTDLSPAMIAANAAAMKAYEETMKKSLLE